MSLSEALRIMRVESLFQAAEVAVALAYLEEALNGYRRRGTPQATSVAARLAKLPPEQHAS